MLKVIFMLGAIVCVVGCTVQRKESGQPAFAEDLAFLKKHVETLVLSSADGQARVAVVPAYQGRIMTSTLAGPGGLSLGWINRALIAAGQTQPHINPYGGEDRFWLGPEGGQYAIFFKKDDPFDLAHWYTPASLDTEPYEIVGKAEDAVTFRHEIALQNYTGTKFQLEVTRTIRLLGIAGIRETLGLTPGEGVRAIAFESENTIKNTGVAPWRKETGLLSVWILGMYNPSPATTVIIPYTPGPEAELGAVVNDAYFGKVPAERLKMADGVIYFRGDGAYRSKIGLSPQRAKPVLGSYDAAHSVLTIVQYTRPAGAVDYVNSMWELQEAPYRGDVVNSYNDGPPAPGARPLGPFYELETSSPAAALAPGASLTHVHRTFHFQGPEPLLDSIARQTFGVSLAGATSAFQNN